MSYTPKIVSGLGQIDAKRYGRSKSVRGLLRSLGKLQLSPSAKRWFTVHYQVLIIELIDRTERDERLAYMKAMGLHESAY